MNKIIEFLNIAAGRVGFKRKKYDNENVPNDLEDIVVVPYFGDIKHAYLLSVFLLNNLTKIKTSKYFILLSYPGFDHIFPYVNEYWQPSDFSKTKQIYFNSDYFENKSEFFLNLIRNLNENFRNVIKPNFFKELYNNKFEEKYWQTFGKEDAEFLIPMVPSSAVIDKEIIKKINSHGNKIFLSPSIYINSWGNGKYKKSIAPKNFYIELIKNLNKKFFPVVWNNNLSYDLNEDFNDKEDCMFVNTNELFEVLPIIRSTGCVLDTFNDLSKFANIAKTPSIILDERNKYFLSREYELTDLLELNIPGKMIFNSSFSIINGNKNYWELDLFKSINRCCEEIIPYIDKETLPSTAETRKKINLSTIRKIKNKRMGSRFIKVNKLI